MNANQETMPCPVMTFMVDQATRTAPVQALGQPGTVHMGVFHDQTDRAPTPGMDELEEVFFGTY